MMGSNYQYLLPELKKTAVYRINKTKNSIQFKMIMLGTIAKIPFFCLFVFDWSLPCNGGISDMNGMRQYIGNLKMAHSTFTNGNK